MSTKSNVFVLVGPPGSGKGSVSSLCIKEFGWKQLSTGNLCRKHIAEQTEIGKQIDFVLKSGKLVSDSIIIDMVNQWLTEQLGSGATVILDGYPRNVVQAEALRKFLEQKEYKGVPFHVVEFVIPDSVVVDRLCSRATCENRDCQAVYSLVEGSLLRPKEDMVCDVCSSPLKIRSDDTLEAVKERLKVYHEHAGALLNFYEDAGLKVLRVDASKKLNDVFDRFKKVVGISPLARLRAGLMIEIKNKSSIRKMEEAGRLLSEIFQEIPSLICPGVSTAEINSWVAQQLKKKGLVSKSKGYAGYKHESCISINQEVIHGIPSKKRILMPGDLVKIDICASWNKYCADMARSMCVDECAGEAKRLADVAQAALDAGISKAVAGNHLSDISSAIQKVVEENGCGVIRDFAGHGIGRNLHEEPEIPNYGKPGTGPILRPGMALAIEPMITAGDYKVIVMNDGWTVKTVDNSLTAHVEDTVIVTDGEPNILTRHRENKNL